MTPEEIDRKFKDLDDLTKQHKHYNPLFDKSEPEIEKTEIPKPPTIQELTHLSDFLTCDFPIHLAHKHNYFGIGGMIKDAYDSYHTGDLEQANKHLKNMYSHLEDTAKKLPEELEIWVDRLAQKILEQSETKKLK